MSKVNLLALSGITGFADQLAVAPGGTPNTFSATGVAKPCMPFTDTSKRPLSPRVNVRSGGATLRLKSGDNTRTVRSAWTVWLCPPPVPVMVSV